MISWPVDGLQIHVTETPNSKQFQRDTGFFAPCPEKVPVGRGSPEVCQYHDFITQLAVSRRWLVLPGARCLFPECPSREVFFHWSTARALNQSPWRVDGMSPLA